MPASVPTVPAVSTVHTPDFESCLQVVENAFALLVAGPDPLAIDGRLIGHGLPRRPIPLDELRAILLHPATTLAARDVAWRVLVARARAAVPAWVVGAVGVAAPALKTASARLRRTCGHADMQAELLTGFLAALHRLDLTEDRIAARLTNAAVVAARAALRADEAASAGRIDSEPGPADPPVPWGHPDLVLARAVRAGIISPREGAVIGATRLEDISLVNYAAGIGSTYEAVKRCRARGEARLVAAMREGILADPTTDTIRAATSTYLADSRPPGE